MMRITKPLRTQIIKPNSITGRGFGFVAVQRALRSLHGSTDGLDCSAYGRFIQICTDRRLDRQGRQLHGRLVIFSIVPDNFLASKLIAFYSRTRRLNIARKVFDEIPHRTTFSWNAMIIALSVHGFHADVLRLFSSMASGEDSGESRPDNFTVTCVMKAVAEMFTDPRLAREVHSYVLRNGFLDSDVFVANSMITCYARCHELVLARALFDRMRTRDVVSWNSMLAAYSQAGFSDECKALFREMVSESGGRDVKPNSGTLVNVVQACGQSKDLAFGAEIHHYMIENGVQGSVILYNALVGFYAKCARFENALELFDWMGEEKDEFTYRSVISGYMAHGLVDEAGDFFGRIRNPNTMSWNALLSGLVQNGLHARGLDSLRTMVSTNRPNSVTLASVLPAISHFANLKSAREIHGHAYRNHCDENIYVTTGIIDAYAKSGHLKGARLIFDRASKKSNNTIVWTAMISAHAAHGDAKSALRIFHEMTTEKGIKPDEVTFTAVLTSCARFGVIDEARKIFESMESRFKVKPSLEHHTCMVSVLGRAGRLAEALHFVSKTGIGSSVGAWGALLDGAAIAGDVRIGKLACDRLFEIEPENAGNYVLLANLYQQAGKFKEAGEVRERMNRAGFKKLAGSSWVALGSHTLHSLRPH